MARRSFYFLSITLFIAACSKDEPEPQLSAYNQSVVAYFKEVALGTEIGGSQEVTRRWEGTMKIFVGGSPTPELLVELDRIIGEINALSTTAFTIEREADTLQSNYYLYFGSGVSFAAILPWASPYVATNYGLFYFQWNGYNELIRGYTYVDIFRATAVEQKHLLREELTQSLGLGNDSPTYLESIFQQSFSTKTTEYDPIDRDVIRLLYHPGMVVGLDAEQAHAALTSILLAEQ